MLLHLRIRNVAIIEESGIDLGEGFHVFTGETGAGKSILIDALLLALGERSSADLLRTGAKEAEINAIFSITHQTHLEQHFATAGITVEDGEVFLRRVITPNGRSRAYINDRPVSAKFLRETGRKLVEISGQHEHHHLMHPRHHLNLLDSFGNLWPDRKQLQQQYNKVQQIRKQLHELGGDAQRRQIRRDYLQYQIEELEETDLDINEDELQQHRLYLMQFEKMLEASQQAEAVLYSGSHAMLEQLGRLQQRLSGWQELSKDLASVVQNLVEAEALLDDAARTLRLFSSSSENDPQEIEDLEQQLTQLRDLKRKHMASSVIGLLERLEEYKQELHDLEQRESLMQKLEANYSQEIKQLRALAENLRDKRKTTATALTHDIEKELHSLGMKKATFSVRWESAESLDLPNDEEMDPEDQTPSDEWTLPSHDQHGPLPGPTGYDIIQFLLSSNPGEEAKPLHRIASGGELSRIMLALKQIITESEPVPTCVFDEVDAGIGGATAITIGEKIRSIAQKRQVICITHLAQIASMAHQHYLIQKQEEGGRTHSRIRILPHHEREQEIARMLGGNASTQSLAHARELLATLPSTTIPHETLSTTIPKTPSSVQRSSSPAPSSSKTNRQPRK